MELSGKITNITRFDTSKNGNPRYHFVIDGHTVFTGVDSMHGYGITNHTDKHCTVKVRMLRGKLTLESFVKGEI